MPKKLNQIYYITIGKLLLNFDDQAETDGLRVTWL